MEMQSVPNVGGMCSESIMARKFCGVAVGGCNEGTHLLVEARSCKGQTSTRLDL